MGWNRKLFFMNKVNVAITQRELIINGELHEALSTLWNEIAKNCGINIINLSSHDEKLLDKISYFECKAVILTGGGDLLEQAFNKNDNNNNNQLPIRQQKEIEIINFCLKNKISLLGICRGMQVLNLFFGGNLVEIDNHVGREVQIMIKNTKYKSLMPNTVLCHHKKGISRDSLAMNFEIIADSDGSIESIIDEKNKVLGFMWHPERNLEKNNKNFYQLLNQFFYA